MFKEAICMATDCDHYLMKYAFSFVKDQAPISNDKETFQNKEESGWTLFFKLCWLIITLENVVKIIGIVGITYGTIVIIKRLTRAKTPRTYEISQVTGQPIQTNINIHQSANRRSRSTLGIQSPSQPEPYKESADIRIWIRKYEILAEGVTEDRKFDLMWANLSEDVQKVMNRYKFSNETSIAYEELKNTLITIYESKRGPMDVLAELNKRTQNENETLGQFASAVESLANTSFRVHGADNEVCKDLIASQFKKGIRSTDVRKNIMLLKTNELKDLLEEAIRIENIYNNNPINEHTAPRRTPSFSYTDSSNGCYNIQTLTADQISPAIKGNHRENQNRVQGEERYRSYSNDHNTTRCPCGERWP
jgi:hypothetical protein